MWNNVNEVTFISDEMLFCLKIAFASNYKVMSHKLIISKPHTPFDIIFFGNVWHEALRYSVPMVLWRNPPRNGFLCVAFMISTFISFSSPSIMKRSKSFYKITYFLSAAGTPPRGESFSKTTQIFQKLPERNYI